jgi:hypothetical protein
VNKRKTITAVITKIPSGTLDFLDWILSLAERVIAIGICIVVFYLGFRLMSGKASASDSQFLLALGQNWKVLLLVLVPLFYPTIRKLIVEAQEIGLYKRRPLPGVPEKDEKRD